MLWPCVQWMGGNESTEGKWGWEKERERQRCVFTLTSSEELTDLAQGLCRVLRVRAHPSRAADGGEGPGKGPLQVEWPTWRVQSRPGRLTLDKETSRKTVEQMLSLMHRLHTALPNTWRLMAFKSNTYKEQSIIFLQMNTFPFCFSKASSPHIWFTSGDCCLHTFQQSPHLFPNFIRVLK